MSVSQPFLDKEDKESNPILNALYDADKLRVNIFAIINQLTETEKKAELITEDILKIVYFNLIYTQANKE
tara:strand:+ start:234 stop:443 length:210 start_codon:yes stop_codon:yes gene_type:complete